MRNMILFYLRKLAILMIVPVSLSIFSCSGDSSINSDNTDETALMELYRKAVKDAESAEPFEICRNLTAIVDFGDSIAGNGNLIWKGTKGNRKVLAVTFTKYADTYLNRLGQSDTARYGDIWITVVPEAKEFFSRSDKKYSSKELTLRMEQLLGLPPNSGYTHMVELWVNPIDIFRPSPDPEIDDSQAELYFRSDVDSIHKAWIKSTMNSIYTGTKPFPWTRLGYTYDWGNQQSEIGLSEFVLRKRSVYEVESVKILAEYFDE